MRVYIDMGGGNHFTAMVPFSKFFGMWWAGPMGGAGAKVRLNGRVYEVYAWGLNDRTWYGWL